MPAPSCGAVQSDARSHFVLPDRKRHAAIGRGINASSGIGVGKPKPFCVSIDRRLAAADLIGEAVLRVRVVLDERLQEVAVDAHRA